MDLRITTLAERPDLLDAIYGMEDSWAGFMTHDPINAFYYNRPIISGYAEHVLIALEPDDEVVAAAYTVPFRMVGDSLPDDGWDWVIRRGLLTRMAGEVPDAVSAIELTITPRLQGRGLSAVMLGAMRDNARRLGFRELLAPVRPNGRTDLAEPFDDYVHRTRADGLPVDPWLRVHVRAGGVIAGIAKRSMVIPGTLEEWRRWTGLPFDGPGPVEVPGGVVPVQVDQAHEVAVYVEPNVWVRHPLAG